MHTLLSLWSVLMIFWSNNCQSWHRFHLGLCKRSVVREPVFPTRRLCKHNLLVVQPDFLYLAIQPCSESRHKSIRIVLICNQMRFNLLNWSKLFENLYQRLFADVPWNTTQEHFRRIVDDFVEAWLQKSAPCASGIICGNDFSLIGNSFNSEYINEKDLHSAADDRWNLAALSKCVSLMLLLPMAMFCQFFKWFELQSGCSNWFRPRIWRCVWAITPFDEWFDKCGDCCCG